MGDKSAGMNHHCTYRRLWAKTGAENKWHSLPCHLLDVAAAAEALWTLTPRASLAVPLQAIYPGERVAPTVAFLAAAHDIGKANRYFQAKDKVQAERLERIGFSLPPLDELKRHGYATGAHLKPWLITRWGWSPFAADCVARAVGGHHGTFFSECNASFLQVNCSPWSEIGPALLDDLADALDTGSPGEPSSLNPFLAWLSGFVCVADWLGSHERMTTWETRSIPFSDYLCAARERARDLLDSLNWRPCLSGEALSGRDIVPRGNDPNALQTLSAEIAQDYSLAIIEAPTGEGKTEAAFILCEPARSNGGAVYFALPTMATANGLFTRVQVYLRAATGDEDLEARLLHSQAWLLRDRASTVVNPGIEGQEQDAQAQDWFSGPKRGLLTPYAVGTIDQVLVAALRAKHGFVRLFALAGKTVVIDEVHAYDVYMADILDVLLGWFRHLGCRVILLSATLPRARRLALLCAWGCEEAPEQSQYPCVTWVNANGEVCTRSFVVQERKPLAVKLLSASDDCAWKQGAARILERVRDHGGLGTLILNTVSDAQSAFQWLQERCQDGIHLDLFHARFAVQDRNEIEKRVLARYGKNGPRNYPAILVATQVIEQSLDLDFDHMITALAPIDLLLQRAGRLHRHARHAGGGLREDRQPDGRPDPVMEVLAPANDENGVPTIKDPVYSHDVLMRTLQFLNANPIIAVPGGVSAAIEAVYGEADRGAIVTAWESVLHELERKTAGKMREQKQTAERASIYVVDDERMLVDSDLDLDENDARQGSQLYARTRLEDRPSVTVVLLNGDSGGLRTVHGAVPEDARDALFASVRVSPPFPLWQALIETEPLPAWRAKGPLSIARPLTLVDDRIVMGGYDIRYSSQKGLEWRRIDADI